MKNKDYSCKRTAKTKPSDLYETPYCLTRELLIKESFGQHVWEPACGKGAIVKVLTEFNYNSWFTDIQRKKSQDFLGYNIYVDNKNIITNPPYSLADEFVLHAKYLETNKFTFLLRMNYLNAQKRTKLKIFKNLKKVYTFNRMPDLSRPLRKDGKCYTGMQTYGWYVWEMGYEGSIELEIIDISKYIARKGE
jgi:hypothetical protein